MTTTCFISGLLCPNERVYATRDLQYLDLGRSRRRFLPMDKPRGLRAARSGESFNPYRREASLLGSVTAGKRHCWEASAPAGSVLSPFEYTARTEKIMSSESKIMSSESPSTSAQEFKRTGVQARPVPPDPKWKDPKRTKMIPLALPCASTHRRAALARATRIQDVRRGGIVGPMEFNPKT